MRLAVTWSGEEIEEKGREKVEGIGKGVGMGD